MVMADFDKGFKIAAHNSGREMCRLCRIHPETWEPIGDTLQTTERLADRAFRASQDGEPFVVYFEAYTTWRDEARWNLLSKSALLSEREHLPTQTLVFLLTADGYREQHGTFQLAVGAQPTQQIWFHEICLWQERPEPWWEQVPGLMALLPLCDHGRTEEDAVKHAAQSITARVADTTVRADLLASLGFFGKLAYPLLDAFALIGRENMRESTFFQEILAEGRAEGRVEGELRRGRQAVLEALEVRFGTKAAAQFREVLDTVTDGGQLSELLRTAIKSRTIGGFRRALGKHRT
jgi:predicted transposase YdaD